MMKKYTGWLVVVAAVALILVSAQWQYRVDLTAEQRYTVSNASEQLLQQLKAPVEITVLLGGDDLPSGFRKLAQATDRFLADCRSISNGNLTYRFVSPDDFMNDSVRFPLDDTFKTTWLKSSAVKLNEVTKTGSAAVFNYPVALVRSGDDFTTVNLLEGQGNKGFLNPNAAGLQFETINNAEAQMEYLFASAISSLQNSYVPTVAYAVGNGEPMGPETYDLSQTLQSKYRFFLLNLQQQPYISDSIKALMIVKPTTPFSDEDKLKIDQYLMRGGKLLLLMDALHADMDSLVRSGKDFTAYGRDLRIDDLMFKYGARINQNLVQDKQSDVLPQAVGMVGDQPQIELLPWPYFPLLYSQSNHPIAKNLDAVVMQFPNSIDTVKAEGIEKNILLTSSNTSRTENAPLIVTVEILKKLDNAAAFKQSNVPLAVLLQGKFNSLFANRLPRTVADSLAAMGTPFLASASKPGQVLITGDGDWVLNGFSREGPLAMGTNPYTQYQFANRNFLLNAIDYMTDETGIMATRSKDFTLRLLDPKKLESTGNQWRMLNIGLPLLLLLMAAGIMQWLRRKRYTR
ncbi:MAG: gliding motility-associated ABC transporter substrate-binding protein GldG [Chitinophagaceae bacterium]|nr:gliding motility-associated ABC transporter substrate-binding protein GldG [Chitinophagaceae bacterium]